MSCFARIVGVVGVVLVALLGWTEPCRADVAPMCSSLDSLITCAKADVGKPCQGAGQCYAMYCANDMLQSTAVYKCAACPPVVPTTDGSCSSYNQVGMSCGTGGTCSVLPSYCLTATVISKLACTGPTPAQPTGPPLGDGQGGAGGAATGGAGGGGAGGAGTGGAGGAPAMGGAGGGPAAGGAGGGAAGAPAGGTSGAMGGAGGRSGGGSGATMGSSGGGGCAVVPHLPSAGVAALALLLIGLLALIVDRRPRRR